MKKDGSMKSFISSLPKAELHLHIDGTLEPELRFQIARRNGVDIKYRSVEEIKAAYQFNNLQDFLDLHFGGIHIMLREEDYFDITWAYLQEAHRQNIIHLEIFFEPEIHTQRGIPFDTVIKGIHRACLKGQQTFGLSTRLIVSLCRELDIDTSLQTLKDVLRYKNWITGIGLASYEVGNPPSKFQKVYDQARQEGLLTVAHAGEEGPPEYVWEALNLLKVSRIDHGFRSLEDEALVSELVRRKIPLTLCPLSNLKLGLFKSMQDYPLKKMMENGLIVTISSDDPAYFGSVNDNFFALQQAFGLDREDIYLLARNSFEASFLEEDQKRAMIACLNSYCGMD